VTTQPVNIPQEIPPPTLDFQTAFRDFLKAYKTLSPEAKRQKLRHVASRPESDQFAELLQYSWTEGLSQLIAQPTVQQQQQQQQHQHQPVPILPTSHANRVCECIDCPYKKELGRIEGFYEDIFSLKG